MTAITQIGLRLLITAGLVVVIYLCCVEIWKLWFDRRIVLGAFTYTKDGQQAKEDGTQFPLLVKHDFDRIQFIHRANLAKIRAFSVRSAAPGDDLIDVRPRGPVRDVAPARDGRPLKQITSGDLRGREFLSGRQYFQGPEIYQAPLADVDITVYGVNLSALIKQLGRWIEQPNEIAGTVSERSGSIYVHSELSGRLLRNAMDFDWDGDIPYKPNRNEASYELACRVFRVLAASDFNKVYGLIADHDFYLYTRALEHYQRYEARRQPDGDLAQASTELKEARKLIEPLAARCRFPFVHELAAKVYRADEDPTTARKSLEQSRVELKRYLDLLADPAYGLNAKPDEEAVGLFALFEQAERRGAALSAEEAAANRRRVRPIRPGVSVGTVTAGAGTLCCIVRDKTTRETYLLSANHVFHDLGRGQTDDPILQPGILDGGDPVNDKVAVLARYQPVKFDGPNRVAGALSRLLAGIETNPEIEGVAKIADVADQVALGEQVTIFGRTSGRASGKVRVIDMITNITFEQGPAQFVGMIAIDPISRPGDSGAPVLDSKNRLVGMVFGASPEVTIVLPIRPTLDALGVELVK
jgi:hypothetical protein